MWQLALASVKGLLAAGFEVAENEAADRAWEFLADLVPARGYLTVHIGSHNPARANVQLSETAIGDWNYPAEIFRADYIQSQAQYRRGTPNPMRVCIHPLLAVLPPFETPMWQDAYQAFRDAHRRYLFPTTAPGYGDLNEQLDVRFCGPFYMIGIHGTDSRRGWWIGGILDESGTHHNLTLARAMKLAWWRVPTLYERQEAMKAWAAGRSGDESTDYLLRLLPDRDVPIETEKLSGNKGVVLLGGAGLALLAARYLM